MEKARAHVYISGFVQGVFFRHNTRERAISLDVRGWVRNLRDGRVECAFEGDRDQVEKMLEWCKVGPPGAEVMKVDVEWEPYKGEFTGFSVLY